MRLWSRRTSARTSARASLIVWPEAESPLTDAIRDSAH